jgi:hypothetical protein
MSRWGRADRSVHSVCVLAVLGAFLAGCEAPPSEMTTEGSAEGPQAPLLEGTPITGPDFLNINGVASLPGGGFAVSDGDLRQVFYFDEPGARSFPVGREGEGPAEYLSVASVHPLRSDSFAVYDPRLDRLTLWHHGLPTGIVEGVPGTLLGVDTLGSMAVARTLPSVTTPTGAIDSVVVLRVRRGAPDAPADTMARLFLRDVMMLRETRGGMSVTLRITNPARPPDAALLLRDGWAAIAFAAPFRVAWRTPSGDQREGPPIPHNERALTGELRDILLAEYGAPSRLGDALDWPDVLPPVRAGPAWRAASAVSVAGIVVEGPDGELLVFRAPEAIDGENRYDVIDRRGRRRGLFRLPAGDVAVGSGPETLYIARVDAEGFQRLLVHPWPPG